MGQRESLRSDATVDRAAAIRNIRPDVEAARNIHDIKRLRDLVLFAKGLRNWVAQFEPSSPATLLAANVIGHHSIDAVMNYIGDALLRLAPFGADDSGSPPTGGQQSPTTGGDAAGGQRPQLSTASQLWRESEQRLIKTLNYFPLLQDHVAGHLRSVPEIPYPYDEVPTKVAMYDSWEPADDETAVVVRNRYSRMADDRYMERSREGVQRTHDRLAHLGLRFLHRFLQQMMGEELAEGFPRMRAVIDDQPPGKRKAKAKRSLKKLEMLTHRLRDLVPEELPGDPAPFGRPHQEFFAANLIEKFVAAGQAYCEDCLPLLSVKRQSRQAKCKAMRRRLAVVAQYAFLVSSNGLYPRFAELLAALDQYARDLHEDTSPLLDAPSAAGVKDAYANEVVRDLNRLSVDPRAIDRLKALLQADARKSGKIIAAIVGDDPTQAKPWDRGDKVPILSKAGLITAKTKRTKVDAVTTHLVRMQQVGLAVQVPFGYLITESQSLPKRQKKDDSLFASDGLPWIVNPLGAVLADVVTKKQPRQKRPGRTSRAKRQDAVISISQRVDGKRPAKSGKKAAAKAAPQRRLPTTKAAKKWPRA